MANGTNSVLKSLLISAVLTGVFCAGFATIIDLATDMLERQQVVVISFLSGFFGSIFAQVVLRKWRGRE